MQICRETSLMIMILRHRITDTIYAFAEKTDGQRVYIFETWRSYGRQDLLLAQGRTKAKAGYSYHNYGLACDLVPGGPGLWSWTDDAIDWDLLGKIGKDHGLAWGGDWAFKDKAHFQLDVLSIQDCHKIAFKHGELAVWAEIQSLL